MTKLLSTTTTTSISLNATLHGAMAAAAALGRGLLTILNSNGSDRLPDRLRYDIGTLYLNPDCRPRPSRSGAPRPNMDHLRSF